MAVVLKVPLLAIQFTREVNGILDDFGAMGVLLMTGGLLYVSMSRKVTTSGIAQSWAPRWSLPCCWYGRNLP